MSGTERLTSISGVDGRCGFFGRRGDMVSKEL